MPKQLNDDQKARLKAAIEAEPSLFNARFYLNHPLHKGHAMQTVANWLNEVGGKNVADVPMVADVMGITPPGVPEPAPVVEPQPDLWKDQRAAIGDALN